MSKWMGILDPQVLKVGMECRSCLDYDSVIDNSDDGNDNEPDDSDWFEAKILSINHRRINGDDDEGELGYEVIVQKQHNDSTWSIFLTDENLEFFEIKVNTWDE